MNCDRAQELLPGYLDGSLGAEERGETEDHLRECSGCAAEERAWNATLSLLRGMPSEKAPPELLEGVRRRIAEEEAQGTPKGRSFASARFRIPFEAAAAVILVLLLYGIQRQLPHDGGQPPAPPPQRMESASAGQGKAWPGSAPRTERIPAPERRGGAQERAESPDEAPGSRGESGIVPVPPTALPSETAVAAAVPRRESAVEAPAGRTSGGVDGGSNRLERESVRAAAGSGLPVVPATRVSSGAEPIAPQFSREGREVPGAAPRVLAASPSHLPEAFPSGREVTLEIPSADRHGLEGRIARAAAGLGGETREAPISSTPTSVAVTGESRDLVRVRIPPEAQEEFLAELRKLGTLAEDGLPAEPGRSTAGSPAAVAYTVRIRVR